MRISDWSSDVCSSDLVAAMPDGGALHVWIGSEGATPYDAVYSLRARRYAANGAAGPELKLADNLGNAVQPRLAADGAGNFAVSWKQSAGYQPPYPQVLPPYPANGTPLPPITPTQPHTPA